jgi:hypothetical protein
MEDVPLGQRRGFTTRDCRGIIAICPCTILEHKPEAPAKVLRLLPVHDFWNTSLRRQRRTFAGASGL